MGLFDWLTKKRVGFKVRTTKKITKRLCPECREEIENTNINPNKVQKEGTFDINCPHCGYKLGTKTVKRIRRNK